jgi:Predicted nucleoside-diphosphate-sugar epimerases
VSAEKLMLVIGATGFLGKYLVDRMCDAGYPIRVVTRGSADWQDSNISTLRHKGVDVIMGDIRDPEVQRKAFVNVVAVVNVLGILRETEDESFEELHVDLVKSLLDLSTEFKVQRFIHVSCIGARSDADCQYFLTKWQGEEMVRESSFYWTIFRPSYLFSDIFPLLSYLSPIVKFKLFLPVIGGGTNSIQPVFVGDLADCIVQSIYHKETVKKTYDIVGPERYSMVGLLENVRKGLKIGGPTVNISSHMSGKAFDAISKAIPRSLLTEDLIGVMSDDACGSADVMLNTFEVKYESLEDRMPAILKSIDSG